MPRPQKNGTEPASEVELSGDRGLNHEVVIVLFLILFCTVPLVGSFFRRGDGSGSNHRNRELNSEGDATLAPTTTTTAAPSTTTGDTGPPDSEKETPAIVDKDATTDLSAPAVDGSSLNYLAKLPKDVCPHPSKLNTSFASLDETTWRWSFAPKSSQWCPNVVSFPIDGPQILSLFRNKRIVFMGDSVARNAFVMTMARMCNAANMTKCMTRTPTMEYDVQNPPHNRGPMGCVPNATDPHAVSPCYRDGRYMDIPLRGLTVKSYPRDKAKRRAFTKKGLIAPVMAQFYGNVTLLYHGVTKPYQLGLTASWMQHHRNSMLHSDVIIVSIGPHLKYPEVLATPSTLVHGLAQLRAVTKAPILVAEFVHALRSSASYVRKVDAIMKVIEEKLVPFGIDMVPQRFITRAGFQLLSTKVEVSEQPGWVTGGCGYYDAQHPALKCQLLTSDLLLAAAAAKLEAYRVTGMETGGAW